jgi:hypothetical protein
MPFVEVRTKARTNARPLHRRDALPVHARGDTIAQ